MGDFLAAMILIVAACGGDDGGGGTAGEDGGGEAAGQSPEGTESGPNQVAVQVDGQAEGFNAAFLAYFPDNVTVHPGDTVVYESVFSGEPHSITFGRSSPTRTRPSAP